METYQKRGYLDSNFRLFHLTDIKNPEFEYHYHDFDKIILFIKGEVDYMIEGKCYHLEPYDIVLVNHNEIHKPFISPESPYERIIVYLSPGFLTSCSTGDCDLNACFRAARNRHSSVLRVRSLEKSGLFGTITDLEHACSQEGFAKELYCQVLFLAFIIQLNRAALGSRLDYLRSGPRNQKIADIMEYIALHLPDDLSVNRLADTFFLSRYHLMHLFKRETGFTIGAYISEKRLLRAKELLADGMSVTQSCFECGFQNYSAFSRAYKKLFNETPGEAKRGK